MGAMKGIYTDECELADAMLFTVSPRSAMGIPREHGWLSPTERHLAMRAILHGDARRALNILRDPRQGITTATAAQPHDN